MSKILFDSLAELVGNIQPGDVRAAFSVGYRGKDFYALAEGEDEAAGAVARSLGMQVGLVPLDMIVAAARRQAATNQPGYAAEPLQGPAAAAPPGIKFDAEVFGKMKVPDLKAYAENCRIDVKGMSKSNILAAIENHLHAKNDPNQAKLPLEGEAGEPAKESAAK